MVEETKWKWYRRPVTMYENMNSYSIRRNESKRDGFEVISFNLHNATNYDDILMLIHSTFCLLHSSRCGLHFLHLAVSFIYFFCRPSPSAVATSARTPSTCMEYYYHKAFVNALISYCDGAAKLLSHKRTLATATALSSQPDSGFDTVARSKNANRNRNHNKAND